ncbi:2'-5' RNA ligase family protein [Streptomyces cremeus]|uniref:2'-5' RNA ligase family protein n=1 Tax=Streptomyces cremeus TaxID=66881 RepID=A0ABV5PE44_STRCM
MATETARAGTRQREDSGAVGWPLAVGDTALTIKVPEADHLVRAGFPAHVTVLFPFLHESLLTEEAERELAAIVASYDSFDLTFDTFRRWPGVLYLVPSPHAPVTALRAELTARWPRAVPYWGVFGDGGLDPHLTVTKGEGPDVWRRAYDALEEQLAPSLPVRTRVRHVDLITWDGRRWHDTRAHPLRRRPGPAPRAETGPAAPRSGSTPPP